MYTPGTKSYELLFDRNGLDTFKIDYLAFYETYIQTYPELKDLIDNLNKFVEVSSDIYLDLSIYVNFFNEEHEHVMESLKFENVIDEELCTTVKTQIAKSYPYTAQIKDYVKPFIKDKFEVLLSNEYKESLEKFWKEIIHRLPTLASELSQKINQYLADKVKILEDVKPNITEIAGKLEKAIFVQVRKSLELNSIDFANICGYFLTTKDVDEKVVKKMFEKFTTHFDEYLTLLDNQDSITQAHAAIDELAPHLDTLYETCKDIPTQILEFLTE